MCVYTPSLSRHPRLHLDISLVVCGSSKRPGNSSASSAEGISRYIDALNYCWPSHRELNPHPRARESQGALAGPLYPREMAAIYPRCGAIYRKRKMSDVFFCTLFLSRYIFCRAPCGTDLSASAGLDSEDIKLRSARRRQMTTRRFGLWPRLSPRVCAACERVAGEKREDDPGG